MTKIIAALTISPIRADTMLANRRSATRGFANWSTRSTSGERCFVGAGSFGPNWVSRWAASADVSPVPEGGGG